MKKLEQEKQKLVKEVDEVQTQLNVALASIRRQLPQFSSINYQLSWNDEKSENETLKGKTNATNIGESRPQTGARNNYNHEKQGPRRGTEKLHPNYPVVYAIKICIQVFLDVQISRSTYQEDQMEQGAYPRTYASSASELYLISSSTMA